MVEKIAKAVRSVAAVQDWKDLQVKCILSWIREKLQLWYFDVLMHLQAQKLNMIEDSAITLRSDKRIFLHY